jgi:hypothetical protein
MLVAKLLEQTGDKAKGLARIAVMAQGAAETPET